MELHVKLCNMHCTGQCSTTSVLTDIYILLVELLLLTVDSSAQMLNSIAQLLAEAAAGLRPIFAAVVSWTLLLLLLLKAAQLPSTFGRRYLLKNHKSPTSKI